MASKLYVVNATIIIFVFVLYCIVLYCIVLYCIVLYFIVLYCIHHLVILRYSLFPLFIQLFSINLTKILIYSSGYLSFLFIRLSLFIFRWTFFLYVFMKFKASIRLFVRFCIFEGFFRLNISSVTSTFLFDRSSSFCIFQPLLFHTSTLSSLVPAPLQLLGLRTTTYLCRLKPQFVISLLNLFQSFNSFIHFLTHKITRSLTHNPLTTHPFDHPSFHSLTHPPTNSRSNTTEHPHSNRCSHSLTLPTTKPPRPPLQPPPSSTSPSHSTALPLSKHEPPRTFLNAMMTTTTTMMMTLTIIKLMTPMMPALSALIVSKRVAAKCKMGVMC